MRDALMRRGFAVGKNLSYYWGLGDEHNEASWGRRVWRPLVYFFGKKS
jgi:hypothetical protein